MELEPLKLDTPSHVMVFPVEVEISEELESDVETEEELEDVADPGPQDRSRVATCDGRAESDMLEGPRAHDELDDEVVDLVPAWVFLLFILQI